MNIEVLETDVCVVGGGPAGCALATVLGLSKRHVLLIDRASAAHVTVGESLPPNSQTTLEMLDLLWGVEQDGHLPCLGNQSAWGTDELTDTDFLFHPQGSGWHLDRRRFDRRLRERAEKAGAVVMYSERLVAIDRTCSGFCLILDSSRGRVEARSRFIADCSGRACSVVRRFGAIRRVEDRLIALALVMEEGPDPSKQNSALTSLVESSVEGWWYTTRIPGSRRVVVYYTDADLPSFRKARRIKGFLELLERTIHVRAYCVGLRPCQGGPHIRSATTTWLMEPIGDGWIAAGDAAIAFDPLSSQGILRAMQGGIAAATAVRAHLDGDESRLAYYRSALIQLKQINLRNRQAFYRQEERWPLSAFWRRRGGDFAGDFDDGSLN